MPSLVGSEMCIRDRSKKKEQLKKQFELEELHVLLVGDEEVGKTCFQMKFIDNWFPNSYKSTMNIDKKKKLMQVGQRSMQMIVWDTPGDVKQKANIESYFEQVDAIIFIYDPYEKPSFDKIFEKWSQNTNNLRVVVGNINNKAQVKRQISYQEAQTIAYSHNYLYYEINIKESKDIPKIMQNIAENLVRIFDKQQKQFFEKNQYNM
eukprot:TRINITY_DN5000_c0_g1_i3.p1 TRINITY_DN5000_c0_g1~~TRINITY_DN5000_c0_g1_i3.p1  ORF type:complete len:206 (+),score=51.11 TRINITY_DN5000_c0_g1_i3:250-867(+)